MAAVELHERLGYGQAETGARMLLNEGIAAPIEALKDAFQLVLVDANARVPNSQFGVTVNLVRPDGDLTTYGCVLTGIAYQVS
jgi:hypothetical protein